MTRAAVFAGLLVFVAWPGDPASGREPGGPVGTDTTAYRLFESEVAPELARSCGGASPADGFGCHAQPEERFDELSGGESHPGGLLWLFPVDGKTGTMPTPEQIAATYASLFPETQSKRLGRARIDLSAAPRFSPIVRKPLSESSGGLVHGGGDVFTYTADPGYRAILAWIALERAQRPEVATPMPGGDAGRFFWDQVLPVMVRNGCMAPACHEINHSNLRFDPGVASADLSEPLSVRFDARSAAANRASALGLITNQLYLTGDVTRSRFIRKVIPLSAGGVLHKGGNDQFIDGPGDPDFEVLAEWARLERRELLRDVTIAGRTVDPDEVGRVRGVLFVRGPTDRPRRFLEPGVYQGGSDLWLLKLAPGETLESATGEPINLTAAFHPDSDADVREPDLRYDARAILFSMRVGADDNLNVYELLLDEHLDPVEGSLRRLTWGPDEAGGNAVHYTDPTWVPSADDTNAAVSGFDLSRADIAYASNVAGEVAPAEEYGVLGEIDSGDPTTLLDWERFEPDGSYVGRPIVILDAFERPVTRWITGFEQGVFQDPPAATALMLDSPLPAAPRPGSHYVIGREPGSRVAVLPAYSLYAMPYPPPGQEEAAYAVTARFTFSPSHELDLSVRSTGEVYFASLRSTGYSLHKPIFNVGRNRRHLDKGLSFPTHRGNRSRVRIYADYHELAGGNDIFVGLSPDSVWGAGNLYVGDHQVGCDLETGNPVDQAAYLLEHEGEPGIGATPSHPRMVRATAEIFGLRGPGGITDHGLSPGGAFRDPRPLPDDSLLVSRAPGPLVLSDPAAQPDFDLYVLAPVAGWYGEPAGWQPPETRLVRIAAASSVGASETQAVPLVVHLKERMRAGRRPAADRYVRKIGERVEPDTRPATYCERNYRVIDAFIDDNSPVGRSVSYDTDPVTGEPLDDLGRVVYVRMVEGLPLTKATVGHVDTSRVANGDAESTLISNGIHPAKRIVAEVPLGEDGSACFPMAPETPFVYQSLNADRMALRSLNRWFFVAPNERFGASVPAADSYQQCAACHGSMTGAPQDTYGPMDVLDAAGCSAACHDADGNPTGYDLTTRTPPALGADRLSSGITQLEAADRVSVTFEADIRPILDRRCVACHDGGSRAEAPDLSGAPTAYYDRGYESLMQLEEPDSQNWDDKRWVAEREALAIESYLVEKVLGRELRAPRALSGDHPHPSPALLAERGAEGGPLSEAERLTLIRWIDLGAAFRTPGSAETFAEGNP